MTKTKQPAKKAVSKKVVVFEDMPQEVLKEETEVDELAVIDYNRIHAHVNAPNNLDQETSDILKHIAGTYTVVDGNICITAHNGSTFDISASCKPVSLKRILIEYGVY